MSLQSRNKSKFLTDHMKPNESAGLVQVIVEIPASEYPELPLAYNSPQSIRLAQGTMHLSTAKVLEC